MRVWDSRRASKSENAWVVGFAIIAVLLTIAMVKRLPHVTGSEYWAWRWARPPLYSAYLYMALSAVPLFYTLYCKTHAYTRRRLLRDLLILSLVNFALQVSGMFAQSPNFARLRQIVISKWATSYYYDALNIHDLKQWLSAFPDVPLSVHSLTHPIGPILYYYAHLQIFGPIVAPYIGGLLVGLIAATGPAVIYAFSGLWTDDHRKRLLAAAIYALLPGLVVFLPEFDQDYPLIAMALILFWERALQRSVRYAVLFGAMLTVALLFAYNLLVLGTFLVLSSVHFLLRHHITMKKLSRLAAATMIAISVLAASFLFLYFFAGYQSIEAFRSAMTFVEDRPHSVARWWNLYDFCLGAGYLIPLLSLRSIGRAFRSRESLTSRASIHTLIGLMTILVVNFTGVLDWETARIWLFLQPLVVVPAAVELGRCTYRNQLFIMALQWVILAVIKVNVLFV